MQTDCVISECVVECLKVKTSREMEEKFMVLEEMLLAERREGRSEGKAEEILSFLGRELLYRRNWRRRSGRKQVCKKEDISHIIYPETRSISGLRILNYSFMPVQASIPIQ